MKPSLTVLMAIRNQSQFLPQALKSLKFQTLPASQYVFIDDASTDNPQSTIKAFFPQATVITLPKQRGLAAALNLGLQHVSTDFIARLDADDIALPHRFELQVKYLQQHKKVAVCGSFAYTINLQGKIIGAKKFPATCSAISRVIMRYNPILHPAAMIRTKVINQLGGYDESLNGAEDYDLWLKINRRYRLANLPQKLILYRNNPQGVSWATTKHVEKQALKARIKALQKYGYPKWQVIYLLKPIFSYLVPASVKKSLFGIS